MQDRVNHPTKTLQGLQKVSFNAILTYRRLCILPGPTSKNLQYAVHFVAGLYHVLTFFISRTFYIDDLFYTTTLYIQDLLYAGPFICRAFPIQNLLYPGPFVSWTLCIRVHLCADLFCPDLLYPDFS
jgi:hypothetical protein